MEEKMKAILSSFDIRKLRSGCNVPGCSRKPDLEVVINQRSHRKGVKSLASLYVCKSHRKNVDALAKKLGTASPGLLTECSISEIKKGR
jgi:hypothetical protein